MKKQPNTTFYVTTPIYYVNDKPHLGHVYTTMVADVLARYHRLAGENTFFLTGVDEHAAKVFDKATEHNLAPQAWADLNATAFRQTFEKLEITHDDFVRTSSDLHKQKVTEYVTALLACGDVYEGEYVGWYDAGQEEYVTEAKAKECDFKSPVNGKPLVQKAEKNYFFRLSAYVPKLLELYEARDQAGRPLVEPEARRNEIVNRIREAKDVPISRTGSNGWGIPVPGDPEQTIYVWIDALFNYLTYVDHPDRRAYWASGPVHLIAKDILWFHAAIWPALLMALSRCPGYEWVYDEQVRSRHLIYSHSYWVSATGEKMSKSLGNFLDPKAIDGYVQEFGLDALRYFLATRGPLGVSDSTFSPDLLIDVYNSELANTFGNSCSRVLNMIGKYFDGQVPPWQDAPTEGAGALIETTAAAVQRYEQAMGRLKLEHAAAAALEVVAAVDGWIERTAPFKLAKDMDANGTQVASILGHCAEALRITSVMLWPLIPSACETLWSSVGCGEFSDQLKNHGQGELPKWTQWGQLKPGTPIEKGPPLFPRYQANAS